LNRRAGERDAPRAIPAAGNVHPVNLLGKFLSEPLFQSTGEVDAASCRRDELDLLFLGLPVLGDILQARGQLDELFRNGISNEVSRARTAGAGGLKRMPFKDGLKEIRRR